MMEFGQHAFGVIGKRIWKLMNRYVMPAVLASLCIPFLPFVMMIGFVSTLPRLIQAIGPG